MRVVCDNCGATYKIPEHKLVREVNKATCRRCGHGIIIRKPAGGAAVQAVAPVVDGESTQITSQDELEARARAQAQAAGNPSFGGAFGVDPGAPSDEVPPTVVEGDHQPGEATMPRQDHSAPPPNPTLAPPPAPATPAAPPAPSRPVQARGPSLAPPPPSAPAPQPTGVPVAAVQPQGHDPSGDMALVLMGSIGAAAGAVLMAVVSDHVLEVIGLAISLASSVTAAMVLLTGDRGRKEASVVVSMAVGIVLAGIVAGGVKFTGIGAEDSAPAVAEAEAEAPKMGTEIPKGALGKAAEEADEQPEEEPDALEDALRAMEEAEADALAEAEEDEPEEEEPPPAADPVVKVSKRSVDPVTKGSSGSTSSKSSSGSTSSKSSSGSTSVTPKARDNPTTSSSSANVGVPVTVLDTMLKSNKGVKRCFGLYRQETGALPKGRITVKLTVQPSGKASSARIDGGAYAGTSLDTCLQGAVTNISFPPWDGTESATYYYPFIL